MSEQSPLEPRMAAVEETAKTLMRDVGILSSDVRKLADSNAELSRAIIAAAAPKKMEWSALITAAAFAMAVGAAALSPMWLRINTVETAISTARIDNQVAIDRLDSKTAEQTRLAAALVKETATVMGKDIEDIKLNGSTSTRERLAVIEYRLSIAAAPPPVPARDR